MEEQRREHPWDDAADHYEEGIEYRYAGALEREHNGVVDFHTPHYFISNPRDHVYAIVYAKPYTQRNHRDCIDGETNAACIHVDERAKVRQYAREQEHEAGDERTERNHAEQPHHCQHERNIEEIQLLEDVIRRQIQACDTGKKMDLHACMSRIWDWRQFRISRYSLLHEFRDLGADIVEGIVGVVPQQY